MNCSNIIAPNRLLLLLLQDTLYIYGKAVEGLISFDLVNHKWRVLFKQGQPLSYSYPHKRAHATAWVADGKLWVFGGWYNRDENG